MAKSSPAPQPASSALVTPEDFDAGGKELPLEYRRGSVPPGLPDKLRVRMLTHLETIECARSGLKKPPDTDEELHSMAPYLVPSLPKEFPDLLDKLMPRCVARLEFVAFVLAHGYDTQEQLREAVNKAMQTALAPAPATAS
jgi:hypothetical protein